MGLNLPPTCTLPTCKVSTSGLLYFRRWGPIFFTSDLVAPWPWPIVLQNRLSIALPSTYCHFRLSVVVGKKHRLRSGRSATAALSRPWANFLHQTCVDGLVKHLSPSTSLYQCLKMTSQWRHRNKSHSWYSVLNSLQNVYFGFFHILKIKRTTPFCNLLMERLSYVHCVETWEFRLSLDRCHEKTCFETYRDKTRNSRLQYHSITGISVCTTKNLFN